MNKLEQLKARKADLGREIERIRADRDFSEGAKARRIAPLYSRFKAEERKTLDEMKAETAERAASKGREELDDYGAELAFGYAELEEPREARHPEAKVEMAGGRDAA